MDFFSSDGVKIAYTSEGEGPPILLIHGFASTMNTNWRDTGWITLLAANGFRVIAFDNRGHGASEKLYDPDAYGAPLMAEDGLRLLDHLDVERAHVMGYSMGARIAVWLGLGHPNRVKSAILGGLGANMILGAGDPAPIARALLADDPSEITDPNACAFRIFADQTKSDRRALAACILGSRQGIARQEIATFKPPVLVAVGSEDAIAGSPSVLADQIAGAEALIIPRRDHMKAVGDRFFKEAALSFLARHG